MKHDTLFLFEYQSRTVWILILPHALTYLRIPIFLWSLSDLEQTLIQVGACFSLSPFFLMCCRQKLGDNSVAQAMFQMTAQVFSGLVLCDSACFLTFKFVSLSSFLKLFKIWWGYGQAAEQMQEDCSVVWAIHFVHHSSEKAVQEAFTS